VSDGVWIRNLEAALLKVLAEIELGSTDKKRTLRIDDHAHPIGLHKDIAVGRPIHKIHLVLKARTAAANHRDTQGPASATLPRKQSLQFRTRSIQYAYESFVSNLVIDRCRGGFHPFKNTAIEKTRKLAQTLPGQKLIPSDCWGKDLGAQFVVAGVSYYITCLS
jgi:hypothetical protein